MRWNSLVFVSTGAIQTCWLLFILLRFSHHYISGLCWNNYWNLVSKSECKFVCFYNIFKFSCLKKKKQNKKICITCNFIHRFVFVTLIFLVWWSLMHSRWPMTEDSTWMRIWSCATECEPERWMEVEVSRQCQMEFRVTCAILKRE